jgi:hypothetical protein
MNKLRISAVLALSVIFSAAAQETEPQKCDCESNFEWVRKTFEENDAGFSLVIAQKGEEAYRLHNEKYIEKVRSVNALNDCTPILYQWLTFFRKGHLGIILTQNAPVQANTPTASVNNDSIIRQFAKWETYNYDKVKFYKHLDNLQDTGMEGVWLQGIYTIGIVKQNETQYIGFIIEADGVYWRPKQVKLKIDAARQGANTLFYMRNHSEMQYNAELVSPNYLIIGNMTFKRLYPLYPSDGYDDYLRAMDAENPYIERLSDKTLMLRLPSFDGDSFRYIDSLIAEHKSLITSTENLIIDMRYNGGGSDRSFREILPLLYTNPVRVTGVEFLSTKLNNRMFNELSTNGEQYGLNEAEKEEYKEAFDTLESRLGQFVNLSKTPVTTVRRDTVYPYPRSVGIITNESNGSTAEQFLIIAKQSRKVKLFGKTTFGCIDVSNVRYADSPCNEFQLMYSTSRSFRIPDMVYDNIGIQPDFFIDKTIPQHKWVDYVQSILENK